ncbi:MAG: subtilase, partial [Acidimicrobiaceae bacterium]
PVAPLAIGALSDLSRLVFVPATLAQGSYFLGVVADPDGQLLEMSEENNAQAAVAPTVVAVSRKPDLILDSVSVPGSISTTQPFLLTRTVRNGSQFGTARGFQEVVYLSVDTQITTDDTPIATFLGPELAPGATSTTTRSITLSQGTPSGSFYVGLIVNPSGSLDEVTTANNAAATASVVSILGSSSLPDLVPTDLTTPFQATAASAMQLQRSISNRGRGSVISAFNESYYMSSGATVTTTDTLVATFPNGALGAGGVSVESRQIAIPSTMPPGDYWLLLQVDPDHRIAEADSTGNAVAAEANNGLRSLARIQVGGAAGALPDLTATSVSAPVEVRRGVAANVTCEVANLGSALAASFTVRFYLSYNRTVEAGGTDVLLGSRSTAPLAVNGRTMLQAFLTVPATQATGNYFILAQIDPTNAIPELTETNNLGVSSQVTVSDTLTLADLVADSLSFSPSRLEPGGTVTLNWSIRNVGGRPAPPFRLQFFASGDTSVGSPDPLLASLELPTLPAGQSLSDVTTAALPSTVTTGAYFVGMAADGDARIVEADERNNSALAPGTLSIGGVLGGADLSGVQVSTPTSATIGGPLLLVLEVHNNGPVGVTASIVNRVYLSSDGTIDGADRKLDEYTLTGVGATAVVTSSRTVFVPRVPPGSYRVLFAVDATNVAGEEIETNNVSDKPILLRGAPDLRFDGFVAPTAAVQAGIPFPVQLLVSNGGNATAQGPILCRVMLSFDGVLDPSDLVLRPIIYPGNLAVGAQASLDTTAAVPDYVSPGSYRLLAVVDPTQTVLEEDESNNVWVQPGPISLGGAADLRAYGVQAPASSVAGSGAEMLLAVSVQNTGAATAAACDTGFFLSTDRTINTSDTFLGSVRAPRLVPGAIAVVQGGFVLPGAFPAGPATTPRRRGS